MEKQYLTVTALTRYIKTKIEYDPHLQSVWLKGEISNFKNHSRGHMYFTLKMKMQESQRLCLRAIIVILNSNLKMG